MSERCAESLMRKLAVILLGVVMLLASACGEVRSTVQDVPGATAAHLSGTWDLSLRVERPMSLSHTPATPPFTVRGTVMLMATSRHDLSFASMRAPTQIGVYELALDSLGLLEWNAGVIPAVAARAVPTSANAGMADSVFMVLNPGVPEREIRLTGVFTGEDVRGVWTAASPLGGGGSFVLQRILRPAAPRRS